MQSILNSRRFRNTLLQALFLVGIAVLAVSAVIVARQNLAAQGITSGFEFLDRSTGFELGYSLIEAGPHDTYRRYLLAGLVNTAFLGIVGIILATIIGLLVAIFRTVKNGVLNAIGTIYIETFRNVPMILQTLFWYALLTQLPSPKQAASIFNAFFFSARGIYMPGLNVSSQSAFLASGAAAVGINILLWYTISRRFRKTPKETRNRTRWVIVLATLALCVVTLFAGRLPDTPLLSVPALRGLNIRDGVRLTPEIMALAISMATYGGAFIAEVLRAGFISVAKGQIEAARSIGLAPWHVFSRVQLPLAIRAVLPTLINQYVWLFKATTLGIAIGFADFFAVVSVSINQAGQTLELIGLLMLGFLLMNNGIAFVLNRVNNAVALKGTQLRA